MIVTALIRAHVCECLAKVFDNANQQPAFFTAGLFSIIDAMLDQPLDSVLEHMRAT